MQSIIYISDQGGNYVHKMQFRIESRLETICKFGSTGRGNYDLRKPCGIALAHQYLYICDNQNKRIKILNNDLNFIDNIPLDFTPVSIKCSDKSIGICGDKEACFIDLKTQEKKNFKCTGRMNFIEPHFYIVSSQSTHIFDDSGNLIETIEMNGEIGKFLNSTDDGFIFFIKNYFFISSASHYRFLKFKI